MIGCFDFFSENSLLIFGNLWQAVKGKRNTDDETASRLGKALFMCRRQEWPPLTEPVTFCA